jgi:hypothetical protein
MARVGPLSLPVVAGRPAKRHLHPQVLDGLIPISPGGRFIPENASSACRLIMV